MRLVRSPGLWLNGAFLPVAISLVALLLVTLPTGTSTTQAETTFAVVAEEGASTPVGGTFSTLRELSINDFGHVVFGALVDGGSTPQAIFLYKDGELYKVVGVGDPAPTGGTFTLLQYPALNNHDQVVFAGNIDGTTEGIFLASGGAIEEVVVAGDPTPVGGTYQGHFRSSSIGVGNGIVMPHINVNDSGDIGFGDKVVDGDVTGALFVWSNGAASTVAAIGQEAPIGGTFWWLDGPDLNNAGQAGFWGATGSPLDSPQAIFLGDTPLIRNGEPSPVGSTFETLYWVPNINDSGQWASWARLADEREGIFMGDGASSMKIMLNGEATPLGGVFSGSLSGSRLGLNDLGQVVFYAGISGGSAASAIWAFSDGALLPAVVSGESGVSASLDSVHLNNRGQIAFRDYGARKIFLANVSDLTPTPTPEPFQYMATGDSIPSGVDLGTSCDNDPDCPGAPEKAYPEKLKQKLDGFSVSLHNIACSGATTIQYLDGEYGYGEPDLCAQAASRRGQLMEAVSAEPDLVTVTVGVDDFVLSRLYDAPEPFGCVQNFLLRGDFPGALKCERDILNDKEAWDGLRARLEMILGRYAHEMTSNSRLVVVVTGYYNPVPTHVELPVPWKQLCDGLSACRGPVRDMNKALLLGDKILRKLNYDVIEPAVSRYWSSTGGRIIWADLYGQFEGQCIPISLTFDVTVKGLTQNYGPYNVGCAESERWIAPREAFSHTTTLVSRRNLTVNLTIATDDGVHPNEEGHQCIANAVWEGVKEQLGSTEAPVADPCP